MYLRARKYTTWDFWYWFNRNPLRFGCSWDQYFNAKNNINYCGSVAWVSRWWEQFMGWVGLRGTSNSDHSEWPVLAIFITNLNQPLYQLILKIQTLGESSHPHSFIRWWKGIARWQEMAAFPAVWFCRFDNLVFSAPRNLFCLHETCNTTALLIRMCWCITTLFYSVMVNWASFFLLSSVYYSCMSLCITSLLLLQPLARPRPKLCFRWALTLLPVDQHRSINWFTI